jgi:site-specific DNA recombinase
VLMSRVSSDEQALGYSLGVQEDSLLKYCARNEIQVVLRFREDHSAKNFERPEFKKFMEYAKKNKGKIDCLLVTTWDRFSRNITDAFVIIQKLRNMGIAVHAIEQPIDPSIPENLAILAMYLAIPEIDNMRRSSKIKSGIRAALKAGRWCWKAPVGYKNTRDEENKPIIIPSEKADSVRYLFEEVSAGKAQTLVISELSDKGLKLSKATVSDMLRNPIYMGKIVVPAKEGEPLQIIEGVHEAIISAELFLKVNQILTENHSKKCRNKYNTAKDELFLRGILICSRCGGHITGSRSKSGGGTRYYYYHCNHCGSVRFRADFANQCVNEILTSLNFKKEIKVLYSEMLKEMMTGSQDDRKRKVVKLKHELEMLESKLTKTQDLLVEGIISREEFQSISQRYSSEKVKIEKQLNELSEYKSEWEQHLKRGISFLTDIEKTFNLADPIQKREILSSIFPEKLVFEKNKCRTPRLNEVLHHMLQIDSKIQNKKTGQFHKTLQLSGLVGDTGFEPMTPWV